MEMSRNGRFGPNPGRGQHFVRACAVEMHMDMSQEPFCVEFCRKSAGCLSWGQCFVRACTVEMHMDMPQEPFCVEFYRKSAGRLSRGQCFVRACTVEMHTFTGKMPNVNPGASILCSLRNRNAHGQVTRGILHINLQGKFRTLPILPRWNTGP